MAIPSVDRTIFIYYKTRHFLPNISTFRQFISLACSLIEVKLLCSVINRSAMVANNNNNNNVEFEF